MVSLPHVSNSLDATAAADLSPALVGIGKALTWRRCVPMPIQLILRNLFTATWIDATRGKLSGDASRTEEEMKILREIGIESSNVLLNMRPIVVNNTPRHHDYSYSCKFSSYYQSL
jgi:hypothetical protein